MTYPLVIDVSHWNGPADWNQVKAKGVSAAIIRAGSIDDATGVCYKDWEFERREERIGFVWGAVFAVALVVLVVFLVAWEVVT